MINKQIMNPWPGHKSEPFTNTNTNNNNNDSKLIERSKFVRKRGENVGLLPEL